MRLVTIQDKAAYGNLLETGILRCKAELAEWLSEYSFHRAYDWLTEQMRRRIGEPPDGVTYPIWAWYLLDYKPAKVDLRRTEFNNYRGENYILTVEIPDNQVLLSDEENWHFVLNDWVLSGAQSEAEDDRATAWFESLSLREQREAKGKSWERIFDITPIDSEWHRNGCFVQATFWELRKEQVLSAKRFVGRQK